ncbi:MAG: hypothetical protein HKN79_10175 [Flavobacteriales bacterium]|nr:hypothetical protein [Flavobacteriales bacterium]
MRITVLLIALCCLIDIQAQNRSQELLFTAGPNYRSSGWLIGLGVSTMWGQQDHEIEFLAIPDSPDAGSYLGTFPPKGRIGLHAEFGMFWLTENSFFDYVDATVSYKQHLGTEEFTALKQPNSLDTLPDMLAGQGEFTQDMVALNVNLNKAFPFKTHWYGLAGIGADIEYRIINSASYDISYPGLNMLPPDESLYAHFHVKAGVGYKTSARSWLSLTAETPIENIVPFNGIESRKTVFNSKYRPVLITLRYQWLRKRPNRECPTGPKKQNLKKKGKGGRSKMKDGQIR